VLGYITAIREAIQEIIKITAMIANKICVRRLRRSSDVIRCVGLGSIFLAIKILHKCKGSFPAKSINKSEISCQKLSFPCKIFPKLFLEEKQKSFFETDGKSKYFLANTLFKRSIHKKTRQVPGIFVCLINFRPEPKKRDLVSIFS